MGYGQDEVNWSAVVGWEYCWISDIGLPLSVFLSVVSVLTGQHGLRTG